MNSFWGSYLRVEWNRDNIGLSTAVNMKEARVLQSEGVNQEPRRTVEDLILDSKVFRMMGALEKLGLIKINKVKGGTQIRTTSRWNNQRRLQPDALPFPLNQQGHLAPLSGIGNFDGITIEWRMSSGDYSHVSIRGATPLDGPIYLHEVQESDSTTGSRSVRRRVFYRDGWIETNRGGVHSRLPMRKGNWDWGKEMDLLTIVTDSLEATAKEAQRRRPLLSKLLGKLTGR